MNPNMSRDIETRVVGNPVVAGAAIDDNGTRVDMAGHEGVRFIAPITDSVITGVATITVQQNTIDSDTGMADLPTAEAAATSGASDDLNERVLIVDVYRPAERFVQLNRKSSVANIAYGAVIAELYGKKKVPATQGATVIQQTIVTSPSE